MPLLPPPTRLSAVCFLLALAAPLAAQSSRSFAPAPARDSASSSQETSESTISPASPRASLAAYFTLVREGQYEEAAAYLELPRARRHDGAQLARQLRAVLDRQLWIDIDQVSATSSGNLADGLPAHIEQLGVIPGPRGARLPVRLTRSQRDGEVRWRFAASTVEQVPTWYAALGDRWILERLPPILLRSGPFDVLWWQWLALPVLLALSVALGHGAAHGFRALLTRLTRRTRTAWDDAILARLLPAISAGATLLVAAGLLPFLALYQPAADAAYRLVRAGFLLAFFWALWRIIDVWRELLSRTRWAHTAAASRSLLPLGGRVAKFAVAAIAAVTILSLLGYPVASLVAGLGLGGLALALAAQKTVENLFGAFAIGADQPFREGDFVKVEDFVGTVERIGLRSTRIRTLERTLITIPNGRLSDMRLESYAARDSLRFHAVVALVYHTTASQMRDVLGGFERVLQQQAKLLPEGMTVRLVALGRTSLDIEVNCWMATTDWNEFVTIRQEILLQFMDVVARAGTAFAFPTQTLHVASMPPGIERRTGEHRTHQIHAAG